METFLILLPVLIVLVAFATGKAELDTHSEPDRSSNDDANDD